MPVSAEVGVDVYFKALVSVGSRGDSLRYCGFHILDKLDDSVTLGNSRILVEAVTLMHCVSDIHPGDLLQQVDLPNNFPILEAHIKWRHSGIVSKNIGRKGWCLS